MDDPDNVVFPGSYLNNLRLIFLRKNEKEMAAFTTTDIFRAYLRNNILDTNVIVAEAPNQI